MDDVAPRALESPGLVHSTARRVAGGGLPAAATVYYCIDDYSALPGVDVETVRRMDADLTARADLVFVASETYLEPKRRLNPSVYYSPHGVDVEHFGAAQAAPAPLPGIGMLRPPVIGFFGVVEKYVDIDLLDYLAQARPEWTFLLIGRVASRRTACPSIPTCYLSAQDPYETLPEYGRHFTVGIIPYRPTDFTYHANPLKLREYLAMGKPVVALRTPQTEQFADIIQVVSSRDEWLRALDHAVSTPQTTEMIPRRASERWRKRAGTPGWTRCGRWSPTGFNPKGPRGLSRERASPPTSRRRSMVVGCRPGRHRGYDVEGGNRWRWPESAASTSRP